MTDRKTPEQKYIEKKALLLWGAYIGEYSDKLKGLIGELETKKAVNLDTAWSSIWKEVWKDTQDRIKLINNGENQVTENNMENRLIIDYFIIQMRFWVNSYTYKTYKHHRYDKPLQRLLLAQNKRRKELRYNSGESQTREVNRENAKNSRKIAKRKTTQTQKVIKKRKIYFTKNGARFVYRFSKVTGQRYKQYLR